MLVPRSEPPATHSPLPFQTAEAESVLFSGGLDTSQNVTEYPLVARALFAGGGASDVDVCDLDGDDIPDLMVALYPERTISIFYANASIGLPTYPSFNISTVGRPLQIAPLALYGSRGHYIASLERDPVYSTTSFVVYNLTSGFSYAALPSHTTYANAVAFAIGEFSGDGYPDVAVACMGSNPGVLPGRLQVFFGPDFDSFELLVTGLSPRAVVAGDFDSDGSQEIAVANWGSSTVMIFDSPFYSGSTPSLTLLVEGKPTGVAAGLLDGDSLVDLAVITEAPSALRFFFQSLHSLPEEEDYNRSLPFAPSFVLARDMDGVTGDDLLLLSRAGNASLGFFQSGTWPLWSPGPDFAFPTGAGPVAAAVGELTGDGLPDIVIASSRPDWSGSSVAIYPHRAPAYSNSNATAWLGSAAVPRAVAAGDVDGDDVQDLLYLNGTEDSFEFVRSFTGTPRSVYLGYVPQELAVADFDGDFISDVVTSMAGGPLITVTMGSAMFPGQSIQLTCGGNVMDFALGDFNHDNLLDLAAATDDGKIDFFFNSGGSTPFESRHEIAPTPGSGIWSLAPGDFNSDGLLDIAFTRPIRKITILFQQPDKLFSSSSPSLDLSHSTGPDFTKIWSGDITGDGKADLVAMRPSDPSLYLFDQSQWFTAPHPYGLLALPQVPRFVSVLDATDRGRADVVAVFEATDLVFLYRQSGGSLPSSPSMVFVGGAEPCYVTVGDGTGDNRGDLLVAELGSHTVSAWAQMNFPPRVDAGGPYALEQGEPLAVDLSLETGTSERPYMEYMWDFGDGTVTGWTRQAHPSHAYIAVGNYTLSVQVRDPLGLAASDTAAVQVVDAVPHVDFSWTPLAPEEGQRVNFTDLTRSFDPVVERRWFLDGSPVGGEPELSLEMQDGTHEVRLEVIDSDGSKGSRSYEIPVSSSAPVVRISAPASALEGVPVTFVALVDEWHGGPVDPIAKYEWDFSYVPDTFVPDRYAPNSDVVSHVFSADASPDFYRVAVRVTDTDGMVSVATWDLAVFDTGPTAGFVLNTSDPREGVPFRFLSTTTSFDEISAWNWTLEHPDGSIEEFHIDAAQMAALEFADLQDGDYRMTLTVTDVDGNTSSWTMPFHVREIPPFVVLRTLPVEGWEGYYEEFYNITFVADVSGLDPGVLFEWDFVAPGAEFRPDATTTANETVHAYGAVGNYTAKVRVTDSDGSVAVQLLSVEVRNKPLMKDYMLYVFFRREFSNTSNVTFDLSRLLSNYPDVVRIVYEFGDGDVLTVDSDMLAPVKHSYALGRDYSANISVTDDDAYTFVIRTVIGNRPPVITLVTPADGAVIRSGSTVLFMITPGSGTIAGACYHFDGGGPTQFGDMYRVDTSGWSEGPHSLLVVASDTAGNVARLLVRLTVDDTPPAAFLGVSKRTLFGGDRVNITVKVNDLNVDASGVVVYVRFPGERAYSAFSVKESQRNVFYRVLELPLRAGNLSMYAVVTDLANNSVETPVFTSQVELRFLTAAWPYMLAGAVLALAGTAGYFVHESRIAVDEAFVIYRDGRLIAHSTRRLKPGMDDQVLGSMFVAIQDFVRESFKDITSFTLRRLDFGEKCIVVEKGEHIYLAAVLHGITSRKVVARMKRVVADIERRFGEALVDWDGDFEKVRGVGELMSRLYSRMPMLPGSLRRRA